MAQSFACSSCGAPLDYYGDMATIQCPYCLTSVIVPPELRSQRATPVEPGVMLSFMAQAAKLRELAAAVRTGQLAQAVDLYQQIYKVSRTEAEQMVGQLSQGGAVIVTGLPTMTVSQSEPVAAPPPPTYSSPPAPPTYQSTPSYTIGTYTSAAAAQPRRSSRLWIVGCGIALIVLCGAFITILLPLLAAGDVLFSAAPEISTALALNEVTEISATRTPEARFTITPRPSPTLTLTAVPTEDPSGPATATAQSATEAAFLASAQQWPVVFSDDFEIDNNVWETGADDNDYFSGIRAVRDGVYRWTITAKQGFSSSSYPDELSEQADFYARLDVRIVGAADSDVGLLFRYAADDSGFYYFALNGNREYAIYLFNHGGWDTLMPPFSTSTAGSGVNTLAVLAHGSRYMFFVNDQNFVTIENDNLQNGFVGLGLSVANANDSLVVEFDNFEVRAPE